VSGNQIHTGTATHREPSDNSQVTMMHNFFIPKSQPIPPPMPAQHLSDKPFSLFELVDYPSDEECDEDEDYEDNPSDGDTDVEDNAAAATISEESEPTRSSADLQTKRRKLEIPVRVMKAQKQEERQKEFQAGLDGIRAVLHSRKTDFAAGVTGLQSYRIRAVQSHLLMLIKNGHHSIEASEQAAESQGFGPKWGGRCI
jgi:hypothetical protein